LRVLNVHAWALSYRHYDQHEMYIRVRFLTLASSSLSNKSMSGVHQFLLPVCLCNIFRVFYPWFIYPSHFRRLVRYVMLCMEFIFALRVSFCLEKHSVQHFLLPSVVPFCGLPFCFCMVQQPLVCQDLIIEASWSHSDTPHSVGLLWTSDEPDAEAYTWQHTDRHTCPQQDSNPQSKQARGLRTTP
jgi:hypothetical protein